MIKGNCDNGSQRYFYPLILYPFFFFANTICEHLAIRYLQFFQFKQKQNFKVSKNYIFINACLFLPMLNVFSFVGENIPFHIFSHSFLPYSTSHNILPSFPPTQHSFFLFLKMLLLPRFAVLLYRFPSATLDLILHF